MLLRYVQIPLDLAVNDRTGLWRITVTERMTGLTKAVYMHVR